MTQILMAAVKTLDLPIGTIVSCASLAEDLEESKLWLPCNGTVEVSATRYSELFNLLKGDQKVIALRVPDLSKRVLRGASSEDAVMNLGGADELSELVTLPDAHSHPLPAHTGLIGLKPPDRPLPKNQPYSVEDDDNGGRWRENRPSPLDGHLVASWGVSPEGQHFHDLGGKTEDSSHSHRLPKLNVVPSHVAVRYYIKAKMLDLP